MGINVGKAPPLPRVDYERMRRLEERVRAAAQELGFKFNDVIVKNFDGDMPTAEFTLTQWSTPDEVPS